MKIKKDKNLSLFKQCVQKRLGKNLVKMILFGSRARNEADKYSDYDCLVILKKCDRSVKNQILEIEGDLLYENNAVFSAFPFSQKDFKLRRFEPFMINALREGVRI
jgi:uncharacterized protein